MRSAEEIGRRCSLRSAEEMAAVLPSYVKKNALAGSCCAVNKERR